MASSKQFCLNTSNFCFLCSEKISNQESTSLQNILQYLNIDLDNIKLKNPLSILPKTDLRVNLCCSCEEINREISKLCKAMEKTRMMLAYNFERIQKKVNLSRDCKNGANYQEGNEMGSNCHSQIVKELHQEIREKCDLKMPNYQPRVTLTDLQLASEAHRHSLPDFDNEELINDFLTPHFLFKEEPVDIESDTGSVCGAKDPVNLDFHLLEDSCPSTGNQSNYSSRLRKSKERKKKSCESPSKSLEFYKTDSVTGALQCSECNKSFKQKGTVLAHYNAIHLNKRFNCALCDKKFKYKRDLKRHNQTCLQKVQQHLAKQKDANFKYVCEMCGKRWASRYGLKKHRQVVHEKAARYLCDFCDKGFLTPSILKTHRDGVHLCIRFTCEFCGKMIGIASKRQHEKACQLKNPVRVEQTPNN